MWVSGATLLLALMGSMSPSATSSPSGSPVASASGGCEAALAAQDEVVALLEAKVVQLEMAGRERALQVRAMELLIEARNTEIAAYRNLLEEEQQAAVRERKRAWWGEKMQAVKWGALGAAVGVLAERFAE